MKKKEYSDEEVEKILRDAKSTGIATGLTGLGAIGGAEFARNAKKMKIRPLKGDHSKINRFISSYNDATRKVAKNVKNNPKLVGTLRGGGIAMTGLGAGILGTRAYISYKNKKKKEKQDDSTEK